MKWIFLSLVSTLALLGLAGPQAQASQIPWSYSFAITPNAIANSDVKVNFYGSDGIGNSTLTLGQIQLRESPSTSAVIIPSGSVWTGTLSLSDASGLSKPLTFRSTLSGTLSPFWNIVSTPLQSTSSILPAGWSMRSEQNGLMGYVWKSPAGNVYTVTPENIEFVGGLPSAAQGEFTLNPNAAGTIIADVQVQEDNINPTTTPEPSTLVLSCIGLGFAGIASWFQRRRALPTQLG